MLNEKIQPKLSIQSVANLLGISVQAAHKKLKSLGWTCPKLGNKLYITHDISKSLFELPKIHPKIIAAQIVKGGTGKTTTIDNIVLGQKVMKS